MPEACSTCRGSRQYIYYITSTVTATIVIGQRKVDYFDDFPGPRRKRFKYTHSAKDLILELQEKAQEADKNFA